MALSQEFLMELKYKNDIESVLSPYIALKRRGSNLVGLCPFHNEKTPSFTVYPENSSYYCFGCGQGGDIISFTMKIENLDYIDAVKRLADRAGLKMPDGDRDDKELKLRNDIYEANREAARYFHNCLMSNEGKAGLDYFFSRGLSLKTIRHFGLGFAPDGWNNLEEHLKKKGFTSYVIQRADLVVKASKTDNKGNTREFTYDRFRNRIIFPIINIHGKVIGFSGRAMPGNEKQGGKYVNTSDTPVYKKSHNMYALNFAKKFCSAKAILVEGNLDVITLHQAGFENAVAALGTSFTEEQARLLSRYTKEVVVMLDADEAGEKATDRAIKILNSAGVETSVLRFPDCKDPDEYIKKHGAARFEALLDGSISEIEYRLYMAAKGIDLEAHDGRHQYLKKACGVLAELGDSIAVDLYAGKLASNYGVAKDVLIREVKGIMESRRKTKNKKDLERIVSTGVDKDDVNPQRHQFRRAAAAEELLIRSLIKHPDMLENIKERVSSEDMLTELNRKVFKRVVEILSSGKEFDLVLLGESFSADEIGYVTRLLTVGFDSNSTSKAIDDSIKVILEEKSNSENGDITELSDDEWANAMQKIKQQKKR